MVKIDSSFSRLSKPLHILYVAVVLCLSSYSIQAATIRFKNPVNNTILKYGTRVATINMEIVTANGFVGSWRFKTTLFPSSGAAGGTNVAIGQPYYFTVSPNASYVFNAALVDGSGNMLSPAVIATASVWISEEGEVSAGGAAYPTTLGGLKAWLDAKDINANGTTFSDNTDISTWKDKSGNGYDATYNAGRPRYFSNSGVPYVRFAASESDGLRFPNTLNLQKPLTIFIVERIYGSNSGRMLQGQTVNWFFGFHVEFSHTLSSGSYVGGITRPPATQNKWYIHSGGQCDSNPLERSFYANGTLIAKDSTPGTSPGLLGVSSGGSQSGQVTDADWQEIVIFNRYLTDAERVNMQNYLAAKWNLTDTNLQPQNAPVVAGAAISDKDLLIDNSSIKTQSSNLTVTQNLYVGKLSQGTMTIQSGASVYAINSYVGSKTGSSGTVTVQDSGTKLCVTTNMNIGSSGTGVINQSNGIVGIKGKLNLGMYAEGSGSYLLSGGSLQVKEIVKGAGSASLTISGGTVATNKANFSFTNGGTVVPYTSPGMIEVVGTLTNGSSGKIALNLTNASQYDSVSVNGTLVAGGTLKLVFGSGYIPTKNTAYKIIKNGTISGTFSTFDFPTSAQWDTSLLYSQGKVSIITIDTDGDGYENDNDSYPLDPARHLPGIDFTTPTANYSFPSSTKTVPIKATCSATGISGFLAYTVNQPFNTGSRTVLGSATTASFNVSVTSNAAYTIRLGMVTSGGSVISEVETATLQFRVNKSGGSISSSDIPGIKLWFDGQSASSFVLSGSQITRWNSLVGGYYATGHSGSLYDSTEKALNLTTHQALDITGSNFAACMMFAVIKSPQATWSNYGTPFGSQDSTRPIIFENGQTYFHSNPFPRTVRKNGTDLSGNFNLSPITNKFVLTSKLAYQTSSRAYRLGGTDGYPAKMYIYELIITDQDLAADKIAYIENYLAGKWGISGGNLVGFLSGSEVVVAGTVASNISRSTSDVMVGTTVLNTASTLTSQKLFVSEEKYSSSALTMSHASAQINASDALVVGGFGAGTFTQSNGTVSANKGIQLARETGSSGTYTISGGSVKTTTISKGTGTSSLQLQGGLLQAQKIDNIGTFSFTGGTLKVITVNMSLTNTGGVFSPGQSPAISKVSGNYTQGSSGTLLMELGGATPGLSASNYDQLCISGNASLNGTLTVVTYNNFVPSIGQTFKLLKVSGTVSGTFASINLPRLSAEKAWSVTNLYTTGVISVVSETDTTSYIIDNKTETRTTLNVISDKDLKIGKNGNGALQLNGSGGFTNANSILGVQSGIAGTATVSGASSLWFMSGYLTVGESGSGTITQTNGIVSVNGTLQLGKNSGSSGTYTLNGGTLKAKTISKGSGTGTLSLNGGFLQAKTINMSMTNGGSFTAADVPETFHVSGNFTQASSGTLLIKLGGDKNDMLTVSGDIALGGTLKVVTVNNYLPPAGSTFSIIKKSGTLAGTFSSVSFPVFRDGRAMTYANGVVSVSDPNGDSDSDGVINSQDAYPTNATKSTSNISITSPTPNYDFASTTTVAINTSCTVPSALTGYMAYTINSDFMTGLRVTKNIGSILNIPVTDNAAYIVRVGLVKLNNTIVTSSVIKTVSFGVKPTGVSSPELVLTSASSPYTAAITEPAKDLKIGKLSDASVAFTAGTTQVGNLILGDRKFIASVMTIQTTVSVNGTVTIAKAPNSTGTLTVSSGVLKANKITKGSGAASFVLTGGTVQANEFGMAITNAGSTLDSNKVTTVNGNFTQTSGKIKIEIRSVSDVDKLRITGVFAAGGLLEVVTSNAVTFAIGQSFDCLDFASKTGSFSGVLLPRLPSSMKWVTDNILVTGVISIAVGDVDNDGVPDYQDAFPNDPSKSATEFIIVSPDNYTVLNNGQALKVTLNVTVASGFRGYIAYTLDQPFTQSEILNKKSTVNTTVKSLVINAAQNSSHILRFGLVNADCSLVESSQVYTRRVAIVDPSTFSPQSLGGLGFWLDAKDESSLIYDSSNRISRWNDKSGNGRNASQRTLGSRPLYDKAQGIAKFGESGSIGNSRHVTANLSFLSNSNYTLFIVERRKNANANYAIGIVGSDTNQSLYFPYANSSTLILGQNSNDLSASIPSYSSPTFNISNGWFSSDVGHKLYYNGELKAENANTNAIVTLSKNGTIGRGGLFNSTFTGDIAEILVYTRALSLVDVSSIENYLADRWGVRGNYLEPEYSPSRLAVGYSIDNNQTNTMSSSLDLLSKNLKVGRAFSGELTINSSAQVSAGDAVIAEFKNTTGNLVVAGSATKVALKNNLVVGNYGDGKMTLSTGLVTVSGSVIIANQSGSQGQLTLQGGKLSAPSVIKGSGTGTFVWTGGTLTAQSIGFAVENNSGTLNATGPLRINGQYTQGVNGKLSLKIGGSNSSILIVTGNMNLNGTLIVTHETGFIPELGQAIKILSKTGSLSGGFKSYQLAPISNFMKWSTANLFTTGEIKVVYIDTDKDGLDDLNDAFPFNNKRTTSDIIILSPNNGAEYVGSTQTISITSTSNVARSFRGFVGYTVDKDFSQGPRLTQTYADTTQWDISVSPNRVYRISVGLVSSQNVLLPSVNVRSIRIVVKDPNDSVDPSTVVRLGNEDGRFVETSTVNQPYKVIQVGESASPEIDLNMDLSAKALEIAGKIGTFPKVKLSDGVTKNITLSEDVVVGQYGKAIVTQSGGNVTIGRKILLAKEVGSQGRYTISTGELSVPTLIKGNGTASMNILGGTVSLSQSDIAINHERGILSPGLPIGTLKMNQGYTLKSDAQLRMDIGGLTPSTDYDVLHVQGNLSLAGTLKVVLANGFTAPEPATFNILSRSGTLTGTFKSISLPTIPYYLEWVTRDIYSKGNIHTIMSDRDRDGILDINDPYPLAITGNVSILNPGSGQLFDLNTPTVAVVIKTNIGPAFRGKIGYTINKELTVLNCTKSTATTNLKVVILVQNARSYTLRVGLINTANELISTVVPRVCTFNVDADTDSDGVGNSRDRFPTDATEWLDTDNDGVGNRHDAYPTNASRTTQNIDILSPSNGSTYTDSIRSVQINIAKTVSELFRGNVYYRVNSLFPVTGNAGGILATSNAIKISVTPNATYTVELILENLTNQFVTESVKRRVEFRTYYDFTRDTDLDLVPDLLDVSPTNRYRSTENVRVISPFDKQSFEGGTSSINLSVSFETGSQFKGYWGYAVNKPLEAVIPTAQLMALSRQVVSIPVSDNRFYEAKISLYSLSGNRVARSKIQTVRFSIRGVAGPATTITAESNVDMGTSVSKPNDQFDVDGQVTIKSGATTEFKNSDIGTKENGSAQVTIKDRGTTLKVNEGLNLGKSSTLNIESGATLTIAKDLRTSGNLVMKDSNTRVRVSQNVQLDQSSLSMQSGSIMQTKGLNVSSGNIMMSGQSQLLASDNIVLSNKASLTISSGSTLRTDKSFEAGNGTIMISSANTKLTIAKGMTVGDEGSFNVSQGANIKVGEQLTSNGNFNLKGAGTTVDIVDKAELQNNTFSIGEGGVITAKSLSMTGGDLSLNDANSIVYISDNVDVSANSEISLGTGSLFKVDKTITLQGDISIASRNTRMEVKGDVNLSDSSRLTISEGGFVKVENNINANGHVDIGVSSTMNIGQTFTLDSPVTLNGHLRSKKMILEEGFNITGNGSLSADTIIGSGGVRVHLYSNGWVLAPGQSPGTSTISGDYTMGSDASLRMEIGGSETASMDRVVILGTFVPNGVMNVSLIYGFVPTLNQTFNLLDWGIIERDARFTTINLPDLPVDIDWDISTFYEDGILRIKKVYFDSDGDGLKDDEESFYKDPTLTTVPPISMRLPVLGAVLWLDAQYPHGDTVVTRNPLQTWVNLSGDSHAEQPTLINRPALLNTGFPRQIVQATGAAYYRISENGVITSKNAVEVFVVMRTTDIQTNQTILQFGTGEFELGVVSKKLTLTQSAHTPSTLTSTGLIENKLQLINVRQWFDNTTAKAAISIDSQAGVTPLVYTTGRKAITGSSRYLLGTGVAGLIGEIGEIVIYDRILSETERQSIDRYLQQKWKLYSRKAPSLFFGSE